MNFGDLCFAEDVMKFETKDKKYKVTFDERTGKLVAYRYGETWRDLCGDNLVLAMLSHINDLEEELGVIYEWSSTQPFDLDEVLEPYREET